jgi:hypothetical protein
MAEHFEYTPLTEAEIDEMTGMAPLKAQAAAGDLRAALAIKRIDDAFAAMRPEIDRFKAEMEREWMEGPSGPPSGLALLIGD